MSSIETSDIIVSKFLFIRLFLTGRGSLRTRDAIKSEMRINQPLNLIGEQ